jgi:hypothetical protein
LNCERVILNASRETVMVSTQLFKLSLFLLHIRLRMREALYQDSGTPHYSERRDPDADEGEESEHAGRSDDLWITRWLSPWGVRLGDGGKF